MTETNSDIHDGIGTYDVVLLVEGELSARDASQIHSLHEDIEDQVIYHVLVPIEDASARVEQSLGLLATGEMMAAPSMALNDVDLDAVRKECEERSEGELEGCVDRLRESGAVVRGSVVSDPPVDALTAKVAEVNAREAIILTRPHLVAEFFHVDWTSKARRKLGVPVLHLLEHETFDEQAGGGEGITGV
jgi:hypothetical protein